MLKYFSFISLPTHLLLVGLIVLLNLPVFHASYFLPSESQILLAAERLAYSSGKLYSEVWSSYTPLIIWIYEVFVHLFGDAAMLVLRIIRCVYLYGLISFFSGFILSHKIPSKNQWMLPVILTFLLSSPWYSLESSHMLFTLFPVTYSFLSLLKLEGGTSRNHNLRAMFWVGIWLMVSLLFSYRILFLVLGFVVAYLIIQSPKISELVSFAGGMLVLGIGLMAIMYYQGNLPAFVDQAVVFPLYGKVGGTSLPSSLKGYSLLLNWGGLMTLAVFGIVHFRLRFYSYVVKVRQIEQLMGIWLFFGIVAILASWKSVALPDFWLIAPPISFYSAKVFDTVKRKRIRTTIGVAVFFPGIFVFLNYWHPDLGRTLLRYAPGFAAIAPAASPLDIPKEQQPYFDFLHSQGSPQPLWILADWPELYHRLHVSPSNKYTQFSMVYEKSPCWGAQPDSPALPESQRSFFLHISDNLPSQVVDPMDIFPSLQACYPSLFSPYSLVEDKGVLIYQRKP